MSFPGENRHCTWRSIFRASTWSMVLAVSFFAVSTPLFGEFPNSAEPATPSAQPAPKLDPLGRETPRSSMIGGLKAGQRRDFATVALYLQQDPRHPVDLMRIARELSALRTYYKGNVNLLSNDPEGDIEAGLPPGQVHAGVIAVGDTTLDVTLVRVNDPVAGKIWLLSKETVAEIPAMYAALQEQNPTGLDRFAILVGRGPQLLGMSLRQWAGWLISIPLSWVLALFLSFLVSLPRRAWLRLRKLPVSTIWQTPLGLPLKCILALLIHAGFVYLIAIPLLYRAYYFRLIAALLAACLAWLVSRVSDRGFSEAVQYSREHRSGGESILILMQRITRVVMLIIALLVVLAMFGLNVKTALAGIGIGGLAIALGAQKTLENLIGGVSLLMDKAVQVGDFCKIGDRVGTVEDIGLRSLKMRTLDQNMLVVPNGLLATMQFENMKARPKLLLNQTFSLRIESRVDQLRFILDRIKNMLDNHPAIDTGSRVRVASFTGAAFQLELFAYGKTGDWTEFTAIRQDVILKIAEIVEAAGTGFAAPTQLAYLARDTGLDEEKTKNALNQVSQLRADGKFIFPGET
ncbi:MAG TPA: mechanosensitive ion channel family protein [Acidobacteriaceae bacterium]|nr:mechanosensitive ion channel family protein [Acidobacteriaceae bacterium]